MTHTLMMYLTSTVPRVQSQLPRSHPEVLGWLLGSVARVPAESQSSLGEPGVWSGLRTTDLQAVSVGRDGSIAHVLRCPLRTVRVSVGECMQCRPATEEGVGAAVRAGCGFVLGCWRLVDKGRTRMTRPDSALISYSVRVMSTPSFNDHIHWCGRSVVYGKVKPKTELPSTVCWTGCRWAPVSAPPSRESGSPVM